MIVIADMFKYSTGLSRLNCITAYYLITTTLYAVVSSLEWTARLSVLFSIIHIDPDPIMCCRLGWAG